MSKSHFKLLGYEIHFKNNPGRTHIPIHFCSAQQGLKPF